MTSSNPRHSSSSNEHYTPVEIVEAARAALGGQIDTDPASSLKAQEVVRAVTWHGREENGYGRSWKGRVFLNPPGGFCDDFGHLVIPKRGDNPPCTETGACGLVIPHEHDEVQSSQKAWWNRLVTEYAAGDVASAIFVCFSVELLQTSQVDAPEDLPIPLDFPVCYPKTRVKYLHEGPDGALVVGGSPPHASCIIGLPDLEDEAGWVERFVGEFSKFGRVVVPR